MFWSIYWLQWRDLGQRIGQQCNDLREAARKRWDKTTEYWKRRWSYRDYWTVMFYYQGRDHRGAEGPGAWGGNTCWEAGEYYIKYYYHITILNIKYYAGSVQERGGQLRDGGQGAPAGGRQPHHGGRPEDGRGQAAGGQSQAAGGGGHQVGSAVIRYQILAVSSYRLDRQNP